MITLRIIDISLELSGLPSGITKENVETYFSSIRNFSIREITILGEGKAVVQAVGATQGI